VYFSFIFGWKKRGVMADKNPQFNAILSRVRDRLRSENVKLWIPPYTTSNDQPGNYPEVSTFRSVNWKWSKRRNIYFLQAILALFLAQTIVYSQKQVLPNRCTTEEYSLLFTWIISKVYSQGLLWAKLTAKSLWLFYHTWKDCETYTVSVQSSTSMDYGHLSCYSTT